MRRPRRGGGRRTSERGPRASSRLWYQRPLGWIALGLGAVATTLLLERALQAYLRRRNARYVAAVQRRTDEVERRNRELDVEAHTDALTGLANRRAFFSGFAHAFADAAQQPLSVLLIDVDDFKKYNDAFGHLAGDDCLRRIATLLVTHVRGATLVARYGGEELVVMAPATDAGAALALARRLCTLVADDAIAQAPSATHPTVTVSIGCATVDRGRDTDAAATLGRADTAMYEAKRAGRNRAHAAT